jgi:hypothetical protein
VHEVRPRAEVGFYGTAAELATAGGGNPAAISSGRAVHSEIAQLTLKSCRRPRNLKFHSEIASLVAKL